MNRQTDRLRYLHNRYLHHTLTPQERKEWIQQMVDPKNEALLQSLMEETWQDIRTTLPEQRLDMPPLQAKATFDRITHVRQHRQTLWRTIAAAAAVLFMLSVGYLLFKPETHRTDIAPGSNKAFLTLSNGQVLILSEEQSGIVLEDSLFYNDGSLLSGVTVSDTASALTLTTPKGGQYQVTLPDGTRVWLNAASSLTYPARFTGTHREVELTGEAYFEVTHNESKPFRVHTEKQDVEVLGTHFHINSYTNEPVVKTTLLEGSVRVYPLLKSDNIQPTLLQPGQQAVLSAKGIQLHAADIDEAMDWKNGEFVCDKEPVESILRKLARWYNVEIEYRDTAPLTERFTGTLSRYEDISTMLDMIEQAGDIRFEIQGRTILVKNKQ